MNRVLPAAPGVYLFKDQEGRVIYVGKAKDLKKRVLSHLRSGAGNKTFYMLRRAKGLDLILTSNEKEAFILENTLIKRHKPRYNIVLRDDSQYPCLRLSLDEPFPRLTIVRRIRKDKARYFGPFSSASAVRSTLRVIDRIFQLRKCKTRELPRRKRPCLNHQLDRCLAPCTGNVSQEEYQKLVRQVIMFLEGKSNELLSHLTQEMEEASRTLEFERAARIRDQIESVKKTIERQHAVSPGMEDQDVIGLAQAEESSRLVVMHIREGRLIGTANYRIKGPGGTPQEVVEAFIKQHYCAHVFIPREILVPVSIEEAGAIASWLSGIAGKRISITAPRRGTKKRLVDMACSNARGLLVEPKSIDSEQLSRALKETLRLEKTPVRIEGLDISTLYGGEAVASLVSFVNGEPEKSGYRNFRIRRVAGMDDYAMLAEAVARRVEHGSLPDLFLVDGGKGQLAVVEGILRKRLGEEAPPVVGIAKAARRKGERADKIYISGRKNPLSLKSGDPALMLLMRIRDEAHRRAVLYHRKLRKTKMTTSLLDQIPGIGPKRKRALLRHFKALEAIYRASEEELLEVPGITSRVAKEIVQFFNKSNHEKDG